MVFKIEQIVIATLLFGFIITGAAFIISDLNTNYNLNIDEGDFSSVVSIAETSINKTTTTTETMREHLLPSKLTLSSAFDAITGLAFNTITIVWSFITIPANLLVSIQIYMGIPPQIVALIIAIVTISILFGIIYMIFGMQPK